MPDKKDFIVIFKVEAEEHLTKLDNGLVELEKKPDNPELIKELNREAHTLKGSARVFGLEEIQEIAHKIEDIFEKVTQKELVFNSAVADKIFSGLDTVRSILKKTANEEKAGVDVSRICQELEACLSPQTARKEKKPDENPPAGEEKTAAKTIVTEKNTEGETTPQKTEHEEYIRVPVSRVNKLLNLASEMVINKMKSSQKIAQVKKLAKPIKEMQEGFSDLGEMIKEKFPPENGEAAKLLSQCNADLQRLKDGFLNLYDDISSEAFYLEPAIAELQNKTKELRMLPCSTIFEIFPRMVRDIASQEGKEIKLEISGEETEADKKVLEGVKTPLMHILRNCIDHGIETPDKRESLGKPRCGTIKLSAYYETGDVIIAVEDDGQGIDAEKIKETVLKKQLVSAKDLEAMTEKEILNIVFMNGYSTSPIITDVSGRGIGLDIARRDIKSLKGNVVLDTQKDKGTKFTIVLPLTIAIIKILLIKTQEMLFALPMSSIEEIIKIKPDGIATIEGRMAIQVRGHTVPVVRLGDVLQLPPPEERAEEQKTNKEEMFVVTAVSLGKWVGFIVDEIVREEEIFIKSMGEHLGNIKNTSGAAILGTGEVVVVLDIGDLITQSRLSHPAILGRKTIPKEKGKRKVILVVDDSLSARELEKNILESHGYKVQTAVDGLDALNKITQSRFDLIVTDINMPRMDGLALCRTLKKNEGCKDIPLVIVTTMEKEEDKRRGIEVGAQAYIAKTAFDQMNLLDAIERLLG